MRKMIKLMEVATGANPYTPAGVREENGDHWYNASGAAKHKRFRDMKDLDINDLIDATVDAVDIGGYTYDPVESSPETGEPSGEMTLDQGGTPVTVDYNGEPHGIYNLLDTEIVLISPGDGRTFGVNWNEVDY